MNRNLQLAFALVAALAARADGPGLSLRISDEAAPAGSVVQIKVDVTEPKPISTGHGHIRPRGMAFIRGIVLMNEGQDTYGVAMVDGDGISFRIVSPSGTFGTPADYPILGIAGTVASAPTGTTFLLTLDPSGLGFVDPAGTVYPTEIKNGTLTVTPGAISIGDVSPGSAVVPAGGVVHIYGANFTPSTRLQLSETTIAEQRFISSGQIDVVVAQTTHMHGLRIRARNDDKSGARSESEYFSYERTSAIGASGDPLFSKTVPLFAPATYTDAVIELPKRSAGKRRSVRPSRGSGPSVRAGFALQNLASSTAVVAIELLDAFGHPYAINTVSIGPDQHLVREIGEVFGFVATPAALRIHSNIPIHLLGLAADPITGDAIPLAPR